MALFMRQKAKHRFLFRVLAMFLLLPLGAMAQYSPEFEVNKNKYPESNKVRLLDEVSISVKLKNNDIEIQQSFVEEDLFLDESFQYKLLIYNSLKI